MIIKYKVLLFILKCNYKLQLVLIHKKIHLKVLKPYLYEERNIYEH